MVNKEREKLEEAIKSWQFVQTLPREIHGFVLQDGGGYHGTVRPIFAYHQPAQHRRVTVVYDEATQDFAVRIAVGLTEYIDPDFIAPDLATLERLLSLRLADTLDGLAHFRQERLGSIFNAKKIVTWSFARQLPREYAGFSLFISPSAPVKVLNGSYIIIDYSDFAAASNFIVYYNILRDEFFGERRLRRKPELLSAFDARTLPELERCLREHLCPTLQELRRHLADQPREPGGEHSAVKEK